VIHQPAIGRLLQVTGFKTGPAGHRWCFGSLVLGPWSLVLGSAVLADNSWRTSVVVPCDACVDPQSVWANRL